jgi:hypothetical protein
MTAHSSWLSGSVKQALKGLGWLPWCEPHQGGPAVPFLLSTLCPAWLAAALNKLPWLLRCTGAEALLVFPLGNKVRATPRFLHAPAFGLATSYTVPLCLWPEHAAVVHAHRFTIVLPCCDSQSYLKFLLALFLFRLPLAARAACKTYTAPPSLPTPPASSTARPSVPCPALARYSSGLAADALLPLPASPADQHAAHAHAAARALPRAAAAPALHPRCVLGRPGPPPMP